MWREWCVAGHHLHLPPKRYNDKTVRPVTYREAKTLLHSRFNEDWKKENGGYQAHLDPVWRLERAQQNTIFRLRTGHCGLSAHLKRIGISDTSLCECGQAEQTQDHVLQSCPKYFERRQLTQAEQTPDHVLQSCPKYSERRQLTQVEQTPDHVLQSCPKYSERRQLTQVEQTPDHVLQSCPK